MTIDTLVLMFGIAVIAAELVLLVICVLANAERNPWPRAPARDRRHEEL